MKNIRNILAKDEVAGIVLKGDSPSVKENSIYAYSGTHCFICAPVLLQKELDPRIRVEFSFAEFIKVNCRNRIALIALTTY